MCRGFTPKLKVIRNPTSGKLAINFKQTRSRLTLNVQELPHDNEERLSQNKKKLNKGKYLLFVHYNAYLNLVLVHILLHPPIL